MPRPDTYSAQASLNQSNQSKNTNIDPYLLQILNKRGVPFNKIEKNILNSWDRYSYHLKLSMINDIDSNDPKLRDKIIKNQIRKIIVAESGVTTSFNLIDCEILDCVGPGFRNRNTASVEVNMTISEPYSTSLADKLYDASLVLGVNNWRMAPLILELTFNLVNENGTVLNTGAATSVTSNIQKVYKLNIIELSSKLTEAGSIYKISASVDNSVGFNDSFFIVPQSIKYTANGGQTANPPSPASAPPETTASNPLASNLIQSIGNGPLSVDSFFQNLGKQITEYYKNVRMKGINGTATTNATPVISYKFWVAPILARQQLDFSTQIGARKLKSSVSGVDIISGRGISISSLVDDILSCLSDSNFFYVDTNNTTGTNSSTQSTGRMRFVTIESRVENIGWDFQLNDYIREITYFINIKETTRPIPTTNFGKNFQSNSTQQTQRMLWMASNTVKRGYVYYYTGNNTEITHLDIDLAHLHLVPMPMSTNQSPDPYQGNSITVPPNSIKGQINQNNLTIANNNKEINNLSSLVQSNITSEESIPVSSVSVQTATTSQTTISNLKNANSSLEASNNVLQIQANADGLVFFDPTTITANSQTNPLNGIKETANANDIRSALLKNQALNQRIIASGNQYLSDVNLSNIPSSQLPTQIINHMNDPMMLSYSSDQRDIKNMVRPPNSTINSARSTYSTIMSQLYEGWGGNMVNIELEIRGDPYWLGIDNLQRTEELDQYLPRSSSLTSCISSIPSSGTSQPTTGISGNPNNGGSSPSRDPGYANYTDYDAAFILVFRAGAIPDEKTGFMNFGKEGAEFFNRIYQTYQVTHIFKDGKFLQKLSAYADPLTSFETSGATQISNNITQPQSVNTINTTPSTTSGGFPTPGIGPRINSDSNNFNLNNGLPLTGSPAIQTAIQSQYSPTAGPRNSGTASVTDANTPILDYSGSGIYTGL